MLEGKSIYIASKELQATLKLQLFTGLICNMEYEALLDISFNYTRKSNIKASKNYLGSQGYGSNEANFGLLESLKHYRDLVGFPCIWFKGNSFKGSLKALGILYSNIYKDSEVANFGNL